MKHRLPISISISLLLVMLLAAGVQAEPVVTDGLSGASLELQSRSPDVATGCVDNTSNWLGRGQNVSTNSGSHWAGVIFVHIPPGSSAMIPTFCTDLRTSIGGGACFVADGPTACPITWLLNNGYGPDNPATNAESAARQAAVWHFSDLLTVNSTDPVYARTQQIIAAVPNPCVLPQSAPVMTLDPPSAVNFLPGGEDHAMTVTVTQDGAPVAGKVVNLSTTWGALSPSSVTTGADGTASFTLTSHETGSATVTASFSYVLPAGTRMVKLPGTADQQVIVLGTPQTGNVIATASKVWETGSKIIVHKFSDTNTNGVQDGGEESLRYWEMKLYRQLTGGSWQWVATKSTDTVGNAIFDNLSPGVYRAEETLQRGWHNTTPNPSAEVNLVDGGQATINFGNVALAVIKAWKFHDLNMDRVRQANEPVLDGWQMNISPAINGIGSGLTAGGSYSFIDLPPGAYRVWETQQAGWAATTDVERTIIVAANDFVEVWFGNVQLGSIGDYVWWDDDRDRDEDYSTETPLPDIHLRLLKKQADGSYQVLEDTITDGGGWYLFDELLPGDYIVDVNERDLPAGYVLTTNNEPYSWALGAGEHHRQADFGYDPHEGTVALGDWVWWDKNSNGQQDDGDGYTAGIRCVTIWLKNSNGVIIGQKNTDTWGYYYYLDLPPGSYSTQVDTSDLDLDQIEVGPKCHLVSEYVNLSVAANGSAASASRASRPDTVYFTTGTTKSTNLPDPGMTDWTLDYGISTSPLAVTLAAFDAQPAGAGVLVTWETVSEINNAGFNLYRAEDAGGLYTLLAYVPSQTPGSTQGAVYSHVDAPLTAGQTYWYWLEDVSLGGATTLHGPVSATANAPTAVTFVGLTTVNTAAGHALPVAGTVLALLTSLAGAAWTQRRQP